ncbi:alpha/beta hydrolase [Flavobacterium sp. TMP13]|uniref:alpha/beta hydrolase n=1 Tax=Flavobacterium sp. TMP13 TaxID=3425950 RepID=UPI003D76AD2E
MRYFFYLLIVTFALTMVGCSSTKITGQPYFTAPIPQETSTPKLNIFVPKNIKFDAPVLIFVHGGNWNSGKRSTYNLLGRNFAKKGIITVIPDYTLSPAANYNEMTEQIAAVIKWTQAHSKEYKGNAKHIFISGHSAGGQLGALAVMNSKYGIDPQTVSGIILNDAAGLDMESYLTKIPPTKENDYLATWTANPENWKDASPIYFIDKNTPTLFIYVGKKTYTSIKEGNANFLKALQPFQPEVSPVYLNKKHIPMVVQYFFPWSHRFDEISDFIKKNSN